jgi:predicted amidophosphoribosyltransferase
MNLRPCPSCGNDVSKQAEFCPNCGHPFESNKEKSNGGITFWGIVGAVVVAILIISFC